MTIYRPPVTKAFSDFSEGDRYSNQVIMTGTDQTMSVPDGAFMLEYLEMDSGTATIKDGLGEQVVTGIVAFNQDRSPIRCDYGITIIGDCTMAKGFIARGIFGTEI